eukprot:UN04480
MRKFISWLVLSEFRKLQFYGSTPVVFLYKLIANVPMITVKIQTTLSGAKPGIAMRKFRISEKQHLICSFTVLHQLFFYTS